MKLTALAAHTPEAVRAALAARGWETQPAWFAATGVQSLVVLLEDVSEPERESLVRWGAKAGADVLTGEGWALVGGAASRLAPLARPDRLPPGLERLAPELGRFLASYVDPPRRWALGGGSALDLAKCPPSENESGVTFTMPMRTGWSRRSTLPPPMAQRRGGSA